MNTFIIDQDNVIVCEYQKTRSGFRHVAVLTRNGREIDRTKCCYLNRTWESYEYETVISKLLVKTGMPESERKNLMEKFGGRSHDETKATLSHVAMVARLGEVFGKTQKESNDWKARMLKAGLSSSGLQMPEDWDTLTEDEKEHRLNGAIEQIQ